MSSSNWRSFDINHVVWLNLSSLTEFELVDRAFPGSRRWGIAVGLAGIGERERRAQGDGVGLVQEF